MATRVKKYREKIIKEIYDAYSKCDPNMDKTELIDKLADKYHISVSTVYGHIRKGKLL